MSDADEALRLTEIEKFYANTALDILAERYDKEEQADHASATRSLSVRVKAHQNQRRPYQASDAIQWQERLVRCGGDAEKVKATLREWWSELCAVSTDPAGTLAESVMPLVDQSVQQAVAQVLMTVEQKMMGLANDPSLPKEVPCSHCEQFSENHSGADAAMNLLMDFIRIGKERLQAGQPMWNDDPHLAEIARQMQAQMQAQAQAQSQGQPIQ